MKHNMLSSIKHKSHKHPNAILFRRLKSSDDARTFVLVFRFTSSTVPSINHFLATVKLYHLFIDWRTRTVVRCFNCGKKRNRYARFAMSRFAFNLELTKTKMVLKRIVFSFSPAHPHRPAMQMRERLAGRRRKE